MHAVIPDRTQEQVRQSVVPDRTQEQVCQSVEGSVLAGAIGDAMGRPTEFISSKEEIYKKYPNGIRSFDDFKGSDFWIDKTGKRIAPYTDDTRMAFLVLQELIKARKKDWELDATMDSIARSFVKDMNDPNGWTKPGRAPGNACIDGARELEERIKRGTENFKSVWWCPFTWLRPAWWNIQATSAGGCGSVMRAHPFGLVFADNPEKAAEWAAEHSKLTHGAPLALAACAAMAVGTAYALQHKDPQFILQKMIEAARKYDEKTAKMIEEVVRCAKEKKPTSNEVFKKFLGWAAHDAIAATAYIFALSHDNLKRAIHLGVHTPGDSDSIASMAGALVGAYTGVDQLPESLINPLEDADLLKEKADDAAALLK